MSMSLMTVTATGDDPPSLSEAAGQIGVAIQRLDAAYGVVPVDPARGLYAVQISGGPDPSPDAASFAGPWASPRIASFGPPESED